MWEALPFGKEISLQIDFAAAAIAVIALTFSIFSFRHQRSARDRDPARAA
jgi:hypothetical protein